MAEKKSFLIRMDGDVLEALRRWADDDLRSLNGQIEFLLRSSLNDAGRAPGSRKQPRQKPPTADSSRAGT